MAANHNFKDANVLITGGMGFIGSNLAIELVEQGAKVTIIDAMIPGYGGNLFNIEPVRNNVEVVFCDVRDSVAVNQIITGRDYIFHLAAQVDHELSYTDPFPDIDININGTTIILEACKDHNPNVKFIYCGTRGQYGSVKQLPVNEETPTNPKGMYETTKLAAEKIIQVYHDLHGIKSVMLRVTNTYGPRSQMLHSRYGVVNWFVRLAVDDQAIKLFGDGQIKRDFLYVDDCVDAMLACALTDEAYGQIFNVGMGKPDTLRELAETLIDVSKTGSWELAPFTPERAAQEPGDFYYDISKIRRFVGWEPEVSLEDGLCRTVEFYRRHKQHYWTCLGAAG